MIVRGQQSLYRGAGGRRIKRDGIEPVVMVRKGAKVRGNSMRDKVVRAVRKGKRKYKSAVGYGRRWLVESFFSVFKRWFGEYVSGVKFENIKKEIMYKVGIINTLLMAGMV